MSSDPKNYFGFTFDEFTEIDWRGHLVYLRPWPGDSDRQSYITNTERRDAMHELGKFVLCKTEIKIKMNHNIRVY